jgi:type IV secretory pathway protease TraF
MEPALRAGDRVLVDRGAYRGRSPVVGEIVAVPDPGDRRRWLVKRVAAIGPGNASLPTEGIPDPSEWPTVAVPEGTVFLLSDHLEKGRDSRHFGPVSRSDLRGRVWYRYSPKETRGGISGSE